MTEPIDTNFNHNSDLTTDSKSKNIFNIQKNSGETVLFDENKLKRSIINALRSAGIEDNPISNQLVDEVIKKLGEDLNFKEGISTLDIREAVEIAMLERGLTSAAQSYHDYKNNPEPTTTDELYLDSQEYSEPTPVTEDIKDQTNLKYEQLVVEDTIEPPELEDTFSPPASEINKPAAGNQNDEKELSTDREARLHQFNLDQLSGYIIVGLYDDKTPAEVLVVLEQQLSPLNQRVLNIFTGIISTGLQNGLSISQLLAQTSREQLELKLRDNQSSEPMLQLLDYLSQWLLKKFN